MALKLTKKKVWVTLSTLLLLVAALVSACAFYVNDYYRTDYDAIAAFAPWDSTPLTTLDCGALALAREGDAGFIFYPGGKVEHTAYLGLMAALYERGVTSVLVEMPFNLAVLDINAADGIREELPHVKRWYIGGHSLGGSMAASYVSKHSDEFSGLVLLGSYSTVDLSESGLSVLSVYGSEDGVMNREKYEQNTENLPKDYIEYVILGGSHAYFGMYGEQSGDGTATITQEEQIRLTADYIAEMMSSDR